MLVLTRMNNKATPIVSVVTAVYNSRRFIGNLVETLKMQTFRNWECIFVDDGSTDGTFEYLKSSLSEDSRFRVLQKKAEGNPTKTRNVGIDNASGRYIAFCDHDDFWTPEKLDFQIKAFEAFPDAAFVHTNRVVWRESQLPHKLPLFNDSKNRTHQQPPEIALYNGCYVTNSSVMAPTSLIRSIGCLNDSLIAVDDYDLFLKLSQKGSIVKIDLPLVYYYWHSSNLSRVDRIFINNLYKLSSELEKLNFPKSIISSIKAQAFKSDGVYHLSSNSETPRKALLFFIKSIQHRFLNKTFILLILACICVILPTSLRLKIVRKLKEVTSF